ncbi:MAG: hypothetical protein HYX75_21780 [Acidobacteria bacterium]|nr:hypothetical protein [Acidobacteriota bacterium]
MERREFVKASSLAIVSVALVPQGPFAWGSVSHQGRVGEIAYVFHGGPFRRSSDGRAHYAGVPFEEMAEDIVHYRMPEKWRERFVLGIEPAGGNR